MLRGGRGSGKTYTAIQKKLIDFRNEQLGNYLFAVNDSNKVTDHFEQTIKDINSDLKLGLTIKMSPLTVYNQYGRKIFCRGFSKGEDVKNISRLKFALLDEVQKFDKSVIDVIVDSVREGEDAQVIMLYNPVSPDLFVKEWEDDPDFYTNGGAVVHSTCEDNPFLPERTKERYRAKKGVDRKINYLGEYGTDLSELVFGEKLERVQEIPKHAVLIGYGLDFSHKYWDENSDPHCIVSLWYADYNLYIDEVFYGHCPIVKSVDGTVEVTDSYDSLLSILAYKNKGSRDGMIPVVGDSSNQTAIDLLNTHGSPYGIVVQQCTKGAGSIMNGINKLKSYIKICITNSSQNVIREFYGYRNKINRKTGKVMSDTIEENQEDHSIDSTRYGDQLANW